LQATLCTSYIRLIVRHYQFLLIQFFFAVNLFEIPGTPTLDAPSITNKSQK